MISIETLKKLFQHQILSICFYKCRAISLSQIASVNIYTMWRESDNVELYKNYAIGWTILDHIIRSLNCFQSSCFFLLYASITLHHLLIQRHLAYVVYRTLSNTFQWSVEINEEFGHSLTASIYHAGKKTLPLDGLLCKFIVFAYLLLLHHAAV